MNYDAHPVQDRVRICDACPTETDGGGFGLTDRLSGDELEFCSVACLQHYVARMAKS